MALKAHTWPGLSKPVYLPDTLPASVKIIPKGTPGWWRGVAATKQTTYTQHFTGNMNNSAASEWNWAADGGRAAIGSSGSYQLIVDGREVIVAEPFDEVAGHAANITGNMTCHACEMAIIASIVCRILDIDVMTILTKSEVQLDPSGLGAVRFKLKSHVAQRSLSAYSIYATFPALATQRATGDLPRSPVPVAPLDLRTRIIDVYGQLDLPSALRSVWDLGIPGLPLRDAGAFHGATWRIDSRGIVVHKQRADSPLAGWSIYFTS
jgi:hypothetical protein